MKTDLFQCSGHCWVFQICWHIECSTFTASSFSIWNSSRGIPSLPLALFIVMLPKAHFTSHSRMSGSRWVITPLWLSAYSLLKRGVGSLSIGLRTGLEQQSPILLAPGTSFMEDKFSLDEGGEECGFGMIQVHLHLLCTLFLLLLHQLHPRSSGIRSQSLQPPGLYGIQWRAQSLTSRMSSLKGGAFPFPRLIELLVMPFLVAQW